MSRVPRLELLYSRRPRRRYFRLALLSIVYVAACGALVAVIVRQHLHNTIGARRAVIAARNAALAKARAVPLTNLEHISVTRSERDPEQLVVTGEGIDATGIRCRFVWRSSSSEPAGSLTVVPSSP